MGTMMQRSPTAAMVVVALWYTANIAKHETTSLPGIVPNRWARVPWLVHQDPRRMVLGGDITNLTWCFEQVNVSRNCFLMGSAFHWSFDLRKSFRGLQWMSHSLLPSSFIEYTFELLFVPAS